MNTGRVRRMTLVTVLACGVIALTSASARADLSSSGARKALTRIPGFELKSNAVRVKSVTANGASAADVSAEVRTVFKFETDKDGKWRVGEIRTAQDRWEQIAVIATAVNAPLQGECNAPDPPLKGRTAVDPSVKRARCLLASLLGVSLPSDAVRIQSVAPMPIPLASQPSATVVAWVRVDGRLVNDKGGWRVAEFRTGNRDWVRLDFLTAAVNDEKQKQARSELELIATALEKFRKDRGFYVVSDSQAVAIDHLSPRYLVRVIRVDPWHQPYKYIGDRDRFTLRSVGPDGKAATSDDIELASPTR